MMKYIVVAILPLLQLMNSSQAENRVDLGSQALGNIRGNLGVNMVAGNHNQQGNLASISLSGPAVIQFSQQNQSSVTPGGHQSVAIHGAALGQNQGLLSINQAAGEANQQLNGFALSLGDAGTSVVTDVNLGNSIASPSPGQLSASMTTSIYLDDNALSGSKGVIQVNQVTGQGNQAVNMVALPLAGAVTASP